MKLVTESRLPDPDRAYRILVNSYAGLTEAESAMIDARLVLLLANHIGDVEVLREAIAIARGCQPPGGSNARVWSESL